MLNGDSLAAKFDLEGDRAIMREALIDGPLRPAIDADFEQVRVEYLEAAYPEVKMNYATQVAAEWHKALQTRADRIYFWFDADAFCQINFLFWLEWLYMHPAIMERKHIFYIRPQPEEFGEMSTADHFGCFNDAMPLGSILLQPAHACWMALAMGDFEVLEASIKLIPQNHFALRSALNWYVKNYWPDKNGRPKLAIELEKYYARNPQIAAYSKQEKFRIFSQQYKKAGLGDLQFWRMIGEG